MSWTQAKAAAESMSHQGVPGHLATLTDQAENDWVWNNALPAAGPPQRYWLGGFQDMGSPSYVEPGGGWTWVTGEAFTYTNWNPGEPNDFGGLEHFLAFDNVPTWNDADDGWIHNAGFLVEYDATVATYCTPKVNSVGCTPAIAGLGLPSASGAGTFDVQAAMVRNNKSGLLFYKANGAQASLAFQCGTLCVGPSGIKRTPATSAGGNPPPANDCSGLFALDVNAFATGAAGGNPDPALAVPGTTVHAQWWGRDQGFAAPCNTTLSDGLEWVQGP